MCRNSDEAHQCAICLQDFCYFHSARCYEPDCADGVTSGRRFCGECLDLHNLDVHSLVRDEEIGVEPPRTEDGLFSDGDDPTTAPHSEGAPESHALDTAFEDDGEPAAAGANSGDEPAAAGAGPGEAPAAADASPNPVAGESGSEPATGGASFSALLSGNRDGDTGGTGLVAERTCEPCDSPPAPCPGFCEGFLDGKCGFRCHRVGAHHNRCVCVNHDLELPAAEAEGAASGINWDELRDDRTVFLERSGTWEGYGHRRPVVYESPVLANFDRREQEAFWEMANKFSARMEVLATILFA